MALTINQASISNQYNIQQKYAEMYKQNNKQKVESTTQNEAHQSIEDLRDIGSSSLKNFLSSDEKKVLKEVFGDLSVDKQSQHLYNSTQLSKLLIGSKIDIKL